VSDKGHLERISRTSISAGQFSDFVCSHF
jgi:hypothetical protein